MQITNLSFSLSTKPQVLASARLELVVEGTDDSIIVDNARVFRNKHGQLWLAMPSYSVPTSNGRSYDYFPAVILSPKLKRQVEEVVLLAFETWEREQLAAVQGGGR
jgi:hypothetical protein